MESRKGLLEKLRTVLCLTIFSLIIFQGCVTKEAVKSASDEEVLRERVKAYWKHKTNQEFDKSYAFEEPIYRKTVNLVNYIRGFGTDMMKWKSAVVSSLKIEGDSAAVDVDLVVKAKLPEIRTFEYNSLVKEKWVKVEGIWYHVPAKFKQRQ